MTNEKQIRSKRFALNAGYNTVFETALHENETIYYAKDALLPILSIKLLVRERSREELSDVDLVIFKLIDQGIYSLASLILLTGLAEKLVRKHLQEMVGRSFVGHENEKFTLTDLGKETLKHGVPIRIVQRALRYCAISEQLLPKEAYGLNISAINELRKKENIRALKFSHALQEKQLVNLAGLDLSKIESKRDLNITDEAIAFEEIKDYNSGFLQTKLFLVGKNKPERAIVAFGKTFREYDPQDIISTVQPLPKHKMEAAIEKELSSDCSSIVNMTLDNFGLPCIELDAPSTEWLSSKKDSAQHAILMCGTKHYRAKPVTSRYLQGYTIRFSLKESAISEQADLLRQFIECGEQYYLTPYTQRKHRQISLFISEKYSEKEIDLIRELAELYSIKRISLWLPKTVEEDAS